MYMQRIISSPPLWALSSYLQNLMQIINIITIVIINFIIYLTGNPNVYGLL